MTVSTVLETRNGRPVAIARAVDALTAAVRNVCDADPSGPCPAVGQCRAGAAPAVGRDTRHAGRRRPAGRRPDQPALGRDRPGPGAARTSPPPPATRPTSSRAGAPRAATRTFLIPQAKLPKRFGITETYGRFATPGQGPRPGAQRLGRDGELREDGTSAPRSAARSSSRTGTAGRSTPCGAWTARSTTRPSVGFWMGVARVGRYVAQVNFTPTGDQRRRRGHLPGVDHPRPRPPLRADPPAISR